MRKTLLTLAVAAVALVAMPFSASAQHLSKAEKLAKVQGMKLKSKNPGEMLKSQQELKAKYPMFFNQKMTGRNLTKAAPARPAHTTVPYRPATVRELPGNRIALKAGSTELIANFAYAPGMTQATDRYMGKFSPSTVTAADVLANGNYNFTSGASVEDGVYYGVAANLTYLNWGFFWIDVYSFDTDSWEVLEQGEWPADDFSMISLEMATSESGVTYGVFYNADGNALELGVVDFANSSRSTIGTLQNQYVALGAAKDGSLYGVATDGNLYKISQATAEETLVGATGLTLMDDDGQYYYQTGEIDQKDDTFYWITTDINTESAALYTVDLATGAATKVQELGEYTVLGMVVAKPAAEEGAPNAVEDLQASFENGELAGVVSFTMPSKTFGGTDLTGDVDYKVSLNGEQVAQGTAAAGSKVDVNVTVAENCMAQFVVVASNAVGDGPKAKTALYVGYDTPFAPTDLNLNIDASRNATFTWTAPTAGTHGGFMGELTYDVYRYVAGERTLVSEKQTATTFTEKVQVDGMSNVAYGVVAFNGVMSSAIAISNGQVVGDAVEIPFIADMTSQDMFALFTVLDANNDGRTWSWSQNYGAYYSYSSNNDADDWLFSPALKLVAGKSYIVTVVARNAGSSYPERFEVKAGAGANADAMTINVIGSTDVTTTAATEYEGEFAVTADGEYNVGVHCTSDADQWNLMVTELRVEKGLEPTAPEAINDLTVTPDADGALKADIAFTASTKSIDGNALAENLVKVELLRDNAVIYTESDVAPGTSFTYTDSDEALTNGTHVYQALAYDAEGVGRKGDKVSAFLGVDVPTSVENLDITDGRSYVVISWDQVGNVGANGGLVKPAEVEYLVWTCGVDDYNRLYLDEKVDSVVAKSRALVDYDTEAGEQNLAYFAVQTRNAAGEGGARAVSLFVGAPYTMPFVETMANRVLNYQTWLYDGSNSSNVGLGWGDVDSDGDGGSFAMTSQADGEWLRFTPGKVAIADGATNPVLLFDYLNAEAANTLKVIIEMPDGSTDEMPVDAVADGNFHTAKVKLGKYASQRYILFYIQADFAKAGQVVIDNIQVMDQLEYNLSADIEAPSTVAAGKEAKVAVTLRNMGENVAEGYTLKLFAGDDELELDEEPTAIESLDAVTYTATFAPSVFDEAGTVTLRAEVEYDLDLDEDDNVVETDIEVTEPTVAAPETVTATANGAAADVNWTMAATTTEEVTEDFESYEAFTIDGWGDWTTQTYTGGETGGVWNGYTHPHQGEQFAYLLTNWPSVNLQSQDGFETPHSGDQALSNIYAYEGQSYLDNDNWLISPELSGEAQTIKFWAKSCTDEYGGLEAYEVYYSTTDTEKESFVKVSEVSAPLEWTEFTADLPAGARYFAIRNVTSGDYAFVGMLDDITYIVGTSSATGFNIYVDEVLVGAVEGGVLTYTTTTLPAGEHKVSVTAVYGDMESRPVSTTLTIEVATAIEDIINADGLKNVYGVDGKRVRQNASSVKDLKRGVYVIDNQKVTVK